MKKKIALMLGLVMLLMTFNPVLPGVRAETNGVWEYGMNEGIMTVTKYTGAGGDVIIPDMFGGMPVKWIGENAFKDCTSLTSVNIPNSITGICGSAFEGCTSLNSVVVPESLGWFAANSFKDCTALTRSLGQKSSEINKQKEI